MVYGRVQGGHGYGQCKVMSNRGAQRRGQDQQQPAVIQS